MEIADNLLNFINRARQPFLPLMMPVRQCISIRWPLMKHVAFLDSEVGYTLQDEELIFDEFREPELRWVMED